MAPAVARHLGLKVVAVALAVLLWLLVAGEQIVERALRVPLEFVNLPAELEIVGNAPDVVEVRIRGSSGALARIGAGEIVAILDLRTARAGPPRLFHLSDSDVRVPFGIDVVQVTPATISMMFEPSVARVVPVVPDIEGTPAPGFAVGTVSADPGTVEVVGPASAVESLREAITEPVSVEGASATLTESATIGTVDPLVRLRVPQSARVTVTVVPAPVEWTIEGLPVAVRNASARAEAMPPTVTLHVRGAREAMQVGADLFEVFVDAAGLAAGERALPVRAVPPPQVGIVRVDPPEVRVRVR